MAIKKSNFTGGNGRRMLHSPFQANVPAETLITHTFTEAVASTDILELAYLPPYCRILDATIFAVGTSTATVDVGLMSGDVGSDDPARTSGDEIFDGITPTTQASATLADLADIAATETSRSIGVKFSANVAASPNTKLILRLRYATGSN